MTSVVAAVLAVAGAWTAFAMAGATRVNELAVAAVVTAYAVVAGILGVARRGRTVGRLLAVGAAAWGIGEGLLAFAVDGVAPGWAGIAGSTLRGVGWLTLILAVPFAFPEGPVPRRARILLLATIGSFSLGTLLAPVPLDDRLVDVENPLPLAHVVISDTLALGGLGLSLVTLALAVLALVRRWRTSGPLDRQRLLWFLPAFALPILFLPLVATPWVAPWMFALASLPVPVAIAVAILQRRLYDVQLAVSRGTTFVALSVAVAGLYALVVAGIGVLLQQTGAPWLPWVGAGAVAVAFAPLHRALQQTVNRISYGQWAAPGEALAGLAQRLDDATDVPGLLDALVRELAAGLRLSSVRLTDRHGALLASTGAATGAHEEAQPLRSYGDPVGTLYWNGELRPSQRHLLDDVAAQLGGVLHAATLLGDLRDARERLVLSREEERRRLRRDLHDGLGPTLGALTLQVDRIRNQLGSSALDTELLGLRGQVQDAVVDVRRIVEGLRPPALDELGLGLALEQLAARASVPVTVDAPPLPPLPAAVEVAAYRIVQEALANVDRHSGAASARVAAVARGGGLLLTVSDDGSGRHGANPGGVGMDSMRERAEEIGGRFSITPMPGRGTHVNVWLPATVASPAEVPR